MSTITRTPQTIIYYRILYIPLPFFFFFFFNFIICDTVNQDSCLYILGEIKTCYLWHSSASSGYWAHFFLTELQFRAWIGCFQESTPEGSCLFSAGNAHSSRAQRQLCRNIKALKVSTTSKILRQPTKLVSKIHINVFYQEINEGFDQWKRKKGHSD